MPAIKLENINVTFKAKEKEVEAVKNVSLEIEKGDIYGIIGYSGAGKSTLVRVINLLQRPTSGKVFVNDSDLFSLSSKELRTERKKIGMIFQHFNLMNSRTVLGNIEYPLLSTNLSKGERRKKAEKLLELVELSGYGDVYPDRLSGGQKQRVAIARALSNDPEVLISDEATSALDPKTTGSILELLQKVNRELGITIVLITHEMQVVKSICKNVAVMDSGKIIEAGPVSEVFIHPKTALSKDFIESSTNVDTAIERILKRFNDWSETKHLLYLKFAGDNTEDGVISRISKETGVDVSILFANMDVVAGVDVGYTVLAISGQKDAIEHAVSILTNAGVETKILK